MRQVYNRAEEEEQKTKPDLDNFSESIKTMIRLPIIPEQDNMRLVTNVDIFVDDFTSVQ